MSTRLREERNRLGLNQTDAAKAGGISFTAYQNYERGDRSPSAETLHSWYLANFDIMYIVTGARVSSSLSSIDSALLSSLNQLDDRLRSAAVAAVLALVKSYNDSSAIK